MKQYADVALPVAVDRPFTYLIPHELRDAVVPGVRVLVPFGRKIVTGLVVQLPATTSLRTLKPIRDVIDAAPVVGDELLRLCTWIAEYYFAPIGEVFKAAVPHGFASSSRRRVRLLFAGEEVLKRFPDLQQQVQRRARILSVLATHNPMMLSDLQKQTGLKSLHATLREIANDGLIAMEEVLPQSTRKWRVKSYVLVSASNAATLRTCLQATPEKRKRVRRLLLGLLALAEKGGGETAVPDLLKKTGASTAMVTELKEAEFLKVVEREVAPQQEFGTEEQTLAILLNDAQRGVLEQIQTAVDGGVHKALLLHGVTGSGKTQVYIEAIRHCLSQQKTAIVLVPEIALTPQIVRRFKSHFAEQVAVVHSGMAAGDRQQVWRLALRGDYRVVIGPRSAVFAPLRNLGLIVVDEEHESSYKQYDASPRYHARDVAIVRAKLNGAAVLLGSATPSVESYQNVQRRKYELLELPRRIDGVPLPSVTIVDMTVERKLEYAAAKEATPKEQRAKLREFQQSSISRLLREKIDDRLRRREGIILLQNRRGFAPFVECPECGHAEMCDQCSITLTYHRAKQHLRCHYCGAVRNPALFCTECGSPDIQLRGIGTQRVEEELARLFPSARVLRMDLDTTTRKGAHDRILRKFGEKEGDILLGTQMVAKGLDFPHVTLVGVISADTQMLLPDFRSSERTFQLLTQVAGRAGRSTLLGEVIIQTHQPAHYTLHHVIDHDFRSFVEQELRTREELLYPPYSRLVLVELKGEREDDVRSEAERFARLLKHIAPPIHVLGPAPAAITKVKNSYRWHIIIKSMKGSDPSGTRMHAALRATTDEFERRRKRSVRLIVDVDPVGLL